MTRTLTKTPRQERSIQTRNDLLDAAERLLRTRPWEKISTVAIMNEAGVSNGAIYGRFKSKDELLVALYDRHDDQLRSRYKQNQEDRKPTPGETIDQYLEREIDYLISIQTENRWLLRAMGILSRQKPEVVTREMRSERRGVFEKIVSRFRPFEHAISGPDKERKIELVVFLTATILREANLYPGPHFDSLDMSKHELRATVKAMAIGFLDVDAEAKARERESGKAG